MVIVMSNLLSGFSLPELGQPSQLFPATSLDNPSSLSQPRGNRTMDDLGGFFIAKNT